MPTPHPIPEAFHELLARPLLMTLATTFADGTIQLTPVWFNFDGTYIYFNSEKDKLKHRILRQRRSICKGWTRMKYYRNFVTLRNPISMRC